MLDLVRHTDALCQNADIERTVARLQLHGIGRRVIESRDRSAVDSGNDLTHRHAAGQQLVEIAVDELTESDADAADADGVGKVLQCTVGPFILTDEVEVAHQADDLHDRRVDHRHTLPKFAIESILGGISCAVQGGDDAAPVGCGTGLYRGRAAVFFSGK